MSFAAFKLLKCVSTNASNEADINKELNIIAEDTSVASSNSPIVIPKTVAESPTYSAESWVRFEMTSAPNNKTENFLCWGPSDTPSSFIRILMGHTSVARDPLASTALSTVTGIDYVDSAYFSAGTGIVFRGASSDGFMDTVGEKSTYLILQIEVSKGASSGDMTSQNFHISYDES